MRTLPFRLKAEALPEPRVLRSGVRDFALLAAFLASGMGLGYYALWKPLLAPLGY